MSVIGNGPTLLRFVWTMTVRTSAFWRASFLRMIVGRMTICAAALALAACAASHFDGTTFRDGEIAFRVGPIPPTARRVETNEALLAFRDDQAGATWAVSARCGKDGDDVPLRALVQHLFLQFSDRKILSEKEFELSGRAALETELLASLDGVQQHFVVTVLKRDGCVYDLMHMDGGGDDARLVQSRNDFRKMVAGFSVLD